MLRALPCPVINTPAAVTAHRLKPLQSARVAALGVPTPATRITNSPAEVRAFFAAHPQGVVVKPIGGGTYVRKLVPADLEREHAIRACPMQYQALVPGEDLRVYVIGERVFAAHIVTRDPGHVDFRTDPTHRSVACELDRDSALRSLRIARALELAFTGIDFRRTPAGELIFLEANPSPMFLRFAADTGHPLTEGLIDLLLACPVPSAPLDAAP
jgi:glutathione synthase/RimK-type ligase-like ATP-grasp enzyme